jgi:hypothetical protein
MRGIGSGIAAGDRASGAGEPILSGVPVGCAGQNWGTARP